MYNGIDELLLYKQAVSHAARYTASQTQDNIILCVFTAGNYIQQLHLHKVWILEIFKNLYKHAVGTLLHSGFP